MAVSLPANGLKSSMTTCFNIVSIQCLIFSEIRKTSYIPPTEYVCTGFSRVLVSPSPKYHIQLMIGLIVAVVRSLKSTGTPGHCLLLSENSAWKYGYIFTYLLILSGQVE